MAERTDHHHRSPDCRTATQPRRPTSRSVKLAFTLATATLLVTPHLTACQRNDDTRPATGTSAPALTPSGPPSAGATAAAPPSTPSSTRPPEPLDPPARFDPGEAEEKSIRALSEVPALVPHEPALRTHFGGSQLPFPLRVSQTALPEGRRAFLVRGAEKDPNPYILSIDARGQFQWELDVPLRGVTPNLKQLALSAGPNGEVALYWHDRGANWIAARMWNADGTILVDYPLLEMDACDALSALYWPDTGYVVVGSHLGQARAQLLSLSGQRTWGENGIDVSSDHTLPSPVSLVLDTPDSVMMVRVGLAKGAGGKKSPNRVLASRYDAAGHPLWDGPVDVGLSTVTEGKIAVSSVQRGMIAIELGPGRSTTLTSGGFPGAK